ncbi:MAG: bacterioferritin [Rickettsiales bacterium]|nr:bacterioferritin [Rickettsiales bacterium]
MSNAEVIKNLNIILKNELTAINQYLLHARMVEHQGLMKLYAEMYKESIDEMKHADLLVKRILFLGGLPNLQNLGKLMIGETPKEMLENDLKLEHIALADLSAAHKVADEAGDVGTLTILEEIINSEEEHKEWLDQQLSLIESIGIENYLLTQV